MSTINNSLDNKTSALTITGLAAARPGVVKASTTGVISALIDSNTDGQLLVASSTGDPSWANLTATGSTLVVSNGHNTINVDTQPVLQISSGWATWGGSGNYYDASTLGSFSILRAGTGYINSVPVSWTATQTITGLTAGNTYWIYIDSTGTIGKATSRSLSLYQNNIVLFEVLRDSTSPTNNQVTVQEAHSYNMPVETHDYLHDSIGTIIEGMGANITLNGTQGIQINGADVLNDQNIEVTIPDSANTAVNFYKYYTNGSGKWALQNSTNVFTGYWNSSGTATLLSTNHFAVYTLYVSKNDLTTATPTYYAVLDTSQYTSQGNANTAIANGTTAQATNELLGLEFAQLGYITYRASTNAISNVIISKTSLHSVLISGGTNVASLVTTNISAFTGILSAADTNVQVALNTIDTWGASTTLHGVLIGEGTGTAIASTVAGSAGQALVSGGASADPVWTTATYPSTVVTGDILAATGTNAIGVILGTSATSNYVLTGNGSGVLPSWKPAAGGGISTLNGDSGSATGSTVTIAGTTNQITTSATGSTLTVSIPSSPTLGGTTTCTTALIIPGAYPNLALTITHGNISLPASFRSSAGLRDGWISFNGNPAMGITSNNSIFIGYLAGGEAMPSQTTWFGANNIGIGQQALWYLGGSETASVGNIALGYQTLRDLDQNGGVPANYNTAIGYEALTRLNYQSTNNTALGYQAGYNILNSRSNNIAIGNVGTDTNNTIWIGTQGTQTITYIAGIYGVTTGGTGVPVLIDSNGNLGTISSSLRYKENVKDMSADSSSVLLLRPVTFNYKTQDKTKRKFGLIAEEVEKIMPELVVYNEKNQPDSVTYHDLPVLLLNEIQKLQERIKVLEAK